MDAQTQTELEAAAFRRLRDHLAERTDVQNIDLMNLSGFCRNCLSRWYQEAAADRDITLDKAEAREIIYGMPFDDWESQVSDRGLSRTTGQVRHDPPRITEPKDY